GDAVFWVFFVVWQAAPAALIVRLRWKDSLSLCGALVAIVVAVAGTAYAWYVATTDSSSTAPILLLFSPVYVLFAVLVVYGVDIPVRDGRRRRTQTYLAFTQSRRRRRPASSPTTGRSARPGRPARRARPSRRRGPCPSPPRGRRARRSTGGGR